VTVGVDDARHGMVLPSQRFGQEALCCGRVLPGLEEKVEGHAGRIHRTIEIAPLALDPDVGLVYPPTVVGRFELRAQTSFQFWGISLDPTLHCDVIGVEASARRATLDVPVRQGKTQIPTNRQKNDFWFKLAPLEQTANRRGQEKHLASISRDDCKVATLATSLGSRCCTSRKEGILNQDSLRLETQALTDFLCSNRIEILNVAGPRESKEPGVYEWTLTILRFLLIGRFLEPDP
jgi:hypothetical protein